MQIGARGITNRGSLRDFESGQKYYKQEQGFQTGAKRFQIEAQITNRDKRDYKPRQGFQIAAGITNQCRTSANDNSYIVALEVCSFYANIPHKERIEAVKQKSQKSKSNISIKVISTFFKLILMLHNFYF